MTGTLNGFSKKEIVNYRHFVCPNCNGKHFALVYGNEDWECCYCKHHIKIKDKDLEKYFGTAYENKTVLTCATCGEKIVCYDGNRVCIGTSIHLYICYKCNSYVSIKYKSQYVQSQYLQPKDCLNIKNKDIKKVIEERILDMYLRDYEIKMKNNSRHL